MSWLCHTKPLVTCLQFSAMSLFSGSLCTSCNSIDISFSPQDVAASFSQPPVLHKVTWLHKERAHRKPKVPPKARQDPPTTQQTQAHLHSCPASPTTSSSGGISVSLFAQWNYEGKCTHKRKNSEKAGLGQQQQLHWSSCCECLPSLALWLTSSIAD